MRRPTRAFKLKVSPVGFDLLVDCHCRLARVTRTLLPYGTTLHVALHHVAAQSSAKFLVDLTDFPAHGLAAPDEHPADPAAGPLVVAGGGVGGLGLLDQLTQRVGRLRVQRDHALGVGLADWDAQPGQYVQPARANRRRR